MKPVTIQFDQQMIDQLVDMGCRNFYYDSDQKDRFENISGGKVGKQGSLNWVKDTMSALVVHQYYIKNSVNAVMLWDLVENPTSAWCIWIDKPIDIPKDIAV